MSGQPRPKEEVKRAKEELRYFKDIGSHIRSKIWWYKKTHFIHWEITKEPLIVVILNRKCPYTDDDGDHVARIMDTVFESYGAYRDNVLVGDIFDCVVIKRGDSGPRGFDKVVWCNERLKPSMNADALGRIVVATENDI
ncbi:hypothetical protein F4779DRAFT_642851 [Xylariaceae sp. FL0662B]|nr:hypothetical protein F4779DRAFT_642851 [Xylariaceae sp. FL0662B]